MVSLGEKTAPGFTNHRTKSFILSTASICKSTLETRSDRTLPIIFRFGGATLKVMARRGFGVDVMFVPSDVLRAKRNSRLTGELRTHFQPRGRTMSGARRSVVHLRSVRVKSLLWK